MKFTALLIHLATKPRSVIITRHSLLSLKLNSAGCSTSSRSSTSYAHLDNTVNTTTNQRYTQNDSRLGYTTSINSRLLHRFHARERWIKSCSYLLLSDYARNFGSNCPSLCVSKWDKVFSYDVVVNTLLWLTSIPLEKSKKHWRRVGPRWFREANGACIS